MKKLLFLILCIFYISVCVYAQADVPVIAVSQKSSSSVAVSWGVVPEATGYMLYRDGALIETTSQTEFIDQGRSVGVEYCYTVRAVSAMGESAGSNRECVTITDYTPPAGVPDIKGEARIFMNGTGELTLRNYENEYPILPDGSFVLFSSSYVYLTIDTDMDIPMAYVNVVGDFHINVGMNIVSNWLIYEDNVNNWSAAVKAGRMEILGPGRLNLKMNTGAAARDYGVWIENSLIIDGEHRLEFTTSNHYGLKTGGYIKLTGGAVMNMASDSVAVYSNSHIMLEGAASMEANSVQAGGAGILLDGNDTGIYLFGGSNPGDVVNINVTSVNGCAVKIEGNGNIISRGNYNGSVAGDWNAKLTATGVTGGVYLTGRGYIKADGGLIQGTRTGIAGNISAVHAPANLYSVNHGKIEEIYKEANLSVTGAPYNVAKENQTIGNNMKNIAAYRWEPADKIRVVAGGIVGKADAANVSIVAERTRIDNAEFTKVDSVSSMDKSMHKIVLDGNSLTANVIFKVYWIDIDYYYGLIDYYNNDMDAFLTDYESYVCAVTDGDTPVDFIINPNIYLSDAIDIPASCSANYETKEMVYPDKPFVMTGNNKIIVFLRRIPG